MLPRHLRNFNLFVDGVGQAGEVDELTLPVLTIKTEEHRAGGMDAPVDVDMGMEKMTMTAVISSYKAEHFRGYGALNQGIPLTIRGVIQRQGEQPQAVVIRVVASAVTVDRGNFTAGGKQTTTITYTLTKYSEQIAGVEVVNIDVPNMIRIVNGVDQLAGYRAALGM